MLSHASAITPPQKVLGAARGATSCGAHATAGACLCECPACKVAQLLSQPDMRQRSLPQQLRGDKQPGFRRTLQGGAVHGGLGCCHGARWLWAPTASWPWRKKGCADWRTTATDVVARTWGKDMQRLCWLHTRRVSWLLHPWWLIRWSSSVPLQRLAPDMRFSGGWPG